MEPTAAIRIAADALTALTEGDTIRAAKRFAPEMRAGLPPEKLGEMWEQFQADHGAFVKRGDATVEERGSVTLCAMRLAFERGAAHLLVGVEPGGRIVGFYLNAHASEQEQARGIAQIHREVWLSVAMAAMVLFGAAMILGSGKFDLKAAGLGAAGWAAAMMLRFPVVVLGRLRHREEEQIEASVTQAVGPLQEAARLGALSFATMTAASAASLGIGWAAFEAIFVSLSAFGAFRSARGDSERAVRVRGLLLRQRETVRAAPAWALVERIASVALHVGAALLLAWEPSSVIVVAIAHLLYVVVPSRLMATSVARADGFAAVVAGVVLTAGIALGG